VGIVGVTERRFFNRIIWIFRIDWIRKSKSSTAEAQRFAELRGGKKGGRKLA
jgi:hypothetical protein